MAYFGAPIKKYHYNYIAVFFFSLQKTYPRSGQWSKLKKTPAKSKRKRKSDDGRKRKDDDRRKRKRGSRMCPELS